MVNKRGSGDRDRRQSSGRGERGLTVRVKTARGRKMSSTLWLQRQLNDPYVKMAKLDGYRGRAAYKIRDIDDRFNFLRQGARVVDLGAAPGGWSQIVADRVNSHGNDPKKKIGKVIGLDLQPMEHLDGCQFIEMDFLDEGTEDAVKELLDGEADCVISDMAPFTTGHKATDHLRIMTLVEAAIYFSIDVLAKDGVFIAKVFEGGATSDLMTILKKYFTKTLHFKPGASRKDSSEKFLIATGFKGKPDDFDINNP